MHRLGIDRMTEDEKDDLKHGLHNAEKHADKILQKLYKAELISRSTQQLIHRKSKKVFSVDDESIDPQQNARHFIIVALRTELEELKHLYDVGLIEQYIYLDLKNTLQRDRESALGYQTQSLEGKVKPNLNLFKHLESVLIKRLREHDWAADILARYQYLRFS